jgi:EmrB/QacA subfamily drug resistance transporter
MMAGNSIALLTAIFPAQERGKALGINTAAVYVGLSVGPSLGGFLVETLGWRSVFYVNVPIGLGVIALALLKIQGDTVEGRAEKLDPLGMITYGVALSMILLGLTLAESRVSLFPRILLVSGFAVLALFIFFETRVASPLLDIRLFKNTPFAFSTLTALLNYSAVFGVSFILSLYLQLVSGFSAEQAGFIMLVQPVTMAVFSPLSGWLSDKVEPRIVASIGMATVSASIYSLSRLDAAAVWWDVSVRLMVLGTGHAFFSSPNTNATMSSVAKRQYGVGAAILSTMRFTGQAVSLAIATSVLSAKVGGVAISGGSGSPIPAEAFMKGMKVALIMLSAICAAGVFTSLVRGRIRSTSSN